MQYVKLCVPVALLLSTAIAHAVQEDSLYVGVDYTNTISQYEQSSDHYGFQLKYKDYLANNLHGVNPYVGMHFGKYLSTEFGYFRSEDKKKSFTSSNPDVDPSDTLMSSKIRMGFYHVDVLGHLPLTEKLSALASIGVVKARSTLKSSSYSLELSDASSTDTTWRVGVGARYAMTDHLGMRVMAHYMQPHFEEAGYSVVRNMMQFSAGIYYSL